METVVRDRTLKQPALIDVGDKNVQALLPLRVGDEVANTPSEVVYILTRYLSGRCDGAVTPDGQGFNKIDARLGHDLAEKALIEWTPRQLWAARKILDHYKNRQLVDFWQYVPDIAEPPKAPEVVAKEESFAKFMRSKDVHWTPPEQFRRLRLTTHKGFDVIELQHSYDERLIAAIKYLPQKIYDGTKKAWYLPLHIDSLEASIDFALEWNYTIPPDVHAKMEQILDTMTKTIELSHAADTDFHVEGLGGEMFPFQRAGVQYAAQVGNVLIADEMGLGKTVQALASIKHGNNFPCIVICPASLKANWAREAKKWLPGVKVNILGGGRKPPIMHFDGRAVYDILIVNYNSTVLEKWLDDFIRLNPSAIICDEAHNVKNPSAQQSMLVKYLINNTHARRIFLSGTPVVNRPMEFWQLLSMLGYAQQMGGAAEYKRRYDTKNTERLQELNARARTMFFVRRRKIDVLKELPPKMYTTVPLEIDNRAAYSKAEGDIAHYFAAKKIEDARWLKEAERDCRIAARELGEDWRALLEIEKKKYYAEKYSIGKLHERLLRWEALKQVAVNGKMASVYDWIEQFLMNSDQKLVVFALHIHVIEGIVNRFAKKFGAVYIHGQVNVEDRMPIVDRFQSDPKCRLIVGHMQAMGEGLTLTAASNVAFIEFPWNPKTMAQAEDRCHRIGQADSVMIWNLAADMTIDIELINLIEEKRAVVDAIQDGAGADTQRDFMEELEQRMEARKRGERVPVPTVIGTAHSFMDEEELEG